MNKEQHWTPTLQYSDFIGAHLVIFGCFVSERKPVRIGTVLIQNLWPLDTFIMTDVRKGTINWSNGSANFRLAKTVVASVVNSERTWGAR